MTNRGGWNYETLISSNLKLDESEPKGLDKLQDPRQWGAGDDPADALTQVVKQWSLGQVIDEHTVDCLRLLFLSNKIPSIPTLTIKKTFWNLNILKTKFLFWKTK